MGKFAILLEASLKDEHTHGVSLVKGHEASDAHKMENHKGGDHFTATQVSSHKVDNLKAHLISHGYSHEKTESNYPHELYHKGNSEIHIHKHPSSNGHHDVIVSTSRWNNMNEDDESRSANRRDRSEYAANHLLHSTHDTGSSKRYHIYVKLRSGRKNIAGPFKSKEEAERHSARAWGDGVHEE